LFGVVQHVVMIVLGQYHRSSKHASGKTSASRLVAATLYDAFLMVW
jgi:hypothetical protein